MWPRVVEVMVSLWLALSPFVFEHPAETVVYWVNDLGAAAAVLTLALFSFWHRAHRAHLGNILVGGYLLVFGYIQGRVGASPATQNELVVGVLLIMLAIIPSDNLNPPRRWLAYYEQRSPSKGQEEGAVSPGVPRNG